MKKYCLKWMCIILLGAMFAVSCDKEEQPKAEFSLVGTWVDDGSSWMRIDMYQLDGTFIESMDWELSGTTFVFKSDGTVTAPWGFDYNYVFQNDTIRLQHEDWADRVYAVIDTSSNHLEMEFPNEVDYTMNGDTPVKGIEIEHWSLKRQE